MLLCASFSPSKTRAQSQESPCPDRTAPPGGRSPKEEGARAAGSHLPRGETRPGSRENVPDVGGIASLRASRAQVHAARYRPQPRQVRKTRALLLIGANTSYFKWCVRWMRSCPVCSLCEATCLPQAGAVIVPNEIVIVCYCCRYWLFCDGAPGFYVEKGWAGECFTYSTMPDLATKEPSTPRKTSVKAPGKPSELHFAWRCVVMSSCSHVPFKNLSWRDFSLIWLLGFGIPRWYSFLRRWKFYVAKRLML